MFKFLKDKLKNVVNKFSHEVKEEVEDTTEEELVEEPQEEIQKDFQEEIVESENEPEVKKEKKKKKSTTEKKKSSPKKKPNETHTKTHSEEELSKEKEQIKKVEEEPVTENQIEDKKKIKQPQNEEVEEIIEKITEETKEQEVKKEKKKGFFGKITQGLTTRTLSEDKFEELFFEIEVAMLENNVALEVIDKIKNDIKVELISKRLPKGNISITILNALKRSIEALFDDYKPIDVIQEIKEKKGPYVIALVGVNGSGKTTATAKLAHLFLNNNLNPILAAADTFRAAAIQQLEEHAKNLKIPIIKQDYGSDPAAVAYDAIEHAKAKGKDVVLIDTSGRLHSNVNLMQELHKIERVAKPDLTIFVGESITGNDCIEQAQKFNEIVGFDGIILTKADIDEKGGAFLSVSYITKRPIIFVGTGQTYDDLKIFNKEEVLENLGL